MSDEAVCRTAPETPGLLNILNTATKNLEKYALKNKPPMDIDSTYMLSIKRVYPHCILLVAVNLLAKPSTHCWFPTTFSSSHISFFPNHIHSLHHILPSHQLSAWHTSQLFSLNGTGPETQILWLVSWNNSNPSKQTLTWFRGRQGEGRAYSWPF